MYCKVIVTALLLKTIKYLKIIDQNIVKFIKLTKLNNL